MIPAPRRARRVRVEWLAFVLVASFVACKVDTGGLTVGEGGNGGGGSGTCALPCQVGRTCCGNGCVNTMNDPNNCGACGHKCTATTGALCSGGKCMVPACTTFGCGFGTTCCGNGCCSSAQLCCGPAVAMSSLPNCFTPTVNQTSCPP